MKGGWEGKRVWIVKEKLKGRKGKEKGKGQRRG